MKQNSEKPVQNPFLSLDLPYQYGKDDTTSVLSSDVQIRYFKHNFKSIFEYLTTTVQGMVLLSILNSSKLSLDPKVAFSCNKSE
jgi:hypothetical protein